MSNKLTIGVAEITSGDKVRIGCDFGNEPLLIAGASIASYTITCTGTGAPAVSSPQQDYAYAISAVFTGDAAGSYDATFAITLDDADASIISRVGTIKVV